MHLRLAGLSQQLAFFCLKTQTPMSAATVAARRVASSSDRNTMNITSLVAASTVAALLPLAAAATSADTPATVAIVKIAKPAGAPLALVRSKMRASMPLYEKLPGLDFKAFSLARPDHAFGGIYLWRDLPTAQAWFNADWFERVRKERGVEGEVRFLQAWVSIDNTAGGTPLDIDSTGVATLVQIALPAAVTQDKLLAGFKAAVPTYQQVPGLLRKYFITSGEGAQRQFGGVYLWRDEASAQAFFNNVWHERVRSTYGTPASVEWFDTPILLPSTLGAQASVAVRARP
jgi:heme-degrading monooxygenase HmoA